MNMLVVRGKCYKSAIDVDLGYGGGGERRAPLVETKSRTCLAKFLKVNHQAGDFSSS